jgi:hypothetical protein
MSSKVNSYASLTGSHHSGAGNQIHSTSISLADEINALALRISAIANSAPHGPIGAHSEAATNASERGPWALDTLDNGRLSVAIPSNLESWSDDFQCISACAALVVLGEHVELVNTRDWPIEQRLTGTQKNSKQYFAGIAHALRHAATQKPPKGGYSGAFGEGYSWIIHCWMEANNIAGAFVIGKSVQPSKYWTGSVWSTNIPQELHRLEALWRRAARSLSLGDLANSYLKTSKQLEGHGIRQDVPWSKVGILQIDEANYLARKYQNGARELENLKASLNPETITLDDIRTLPSSIRKVSSALKEPSLIVDRTTTLRFKALNQGKSKKEIQLANKMPISARLAEMDLETKICFFNPVILTGKIFYMDKELATAVERGNPDAIGEVKSNLMKFAAAQSDLEYSKLMESFISTF